MLIDRLLDGLNPRSLAFMMFALFSLTLLAAHLYLFKVPLNSYRQMASALLALEQGSLVQVPWERQIARLEEEVKSLDQQLYGNASALPNNQMVAHVVAELDIAARAHDVTLIGVQPAKVSRVIVFDEIPFNIEVKGNYFDLVDWLREVESRLGAMVVKEFLIDEGKTSDQRHMRITIASYRVAEES